MVTSDVIGTPHLQVTIYKLSLASTFSIVNFKDTLSQFPFFLMLFLCCECDCVAKPPSFPSTLFVHLSIVGDKL